MMEPVMDAGAEIVARTQAQIVFVFPQALPPKAQMLQPEFPAAGSDTKVTFTVGTVVWNGLGLPLNRTPAVLLDQL